MDLSRVDTLDLKAELDRRAAAMRAPAVKVDPDWLPVVNACMGVVASVEDHGEHDDPEQHVFEAAMEAVYGPELWPWWNAHYGSR